MGGGETAEGCWVTEGWTTWLLSGTESAGGDLHLIAFEKYSR